MSRRLLKNILFIIFIVFLSFFSYYKFFKQQEKISVIEKIDVEDTITSTNIIQDVNYSSQDVKGNEYILYASEGQIDLDNNKIIFLTKVRAKIKMIDGDVIEIQSNFGKYNIDNYDTIFSKKVKINYRDNEIKGDYVDFSLNNNSLIISKNVVYSNQKNLLKADALEIDIETKNTKIFMYEKEKKVKIKSLKNHGNN